MESSQDVNEEHERGIWHCMSEGRNEENKKQFYVFIFTELRLLSKLVIHVFSNFFAF